MSDRLRPWLPVAGCVAALLVVALLAPDPASAALQKIAGYKASRRRRSGS